MIEINDLGVYCTDCGLTQDFYRLEIIKTKGNLDYKNTYKCLNCSGNKFQIYSIIK